MLFKIIIALILGVLMTPSSFSNSDKSFTKLDLLSYYIYNHSNNNELVSTHIAQAIILAGGDVKTLTAIGQVESRFNPTAKGDSGSSEGIFQIQKKHWGVVTSNVYQQARKASVILKYVKSIRNYNCGSRVYEAKVLRAKREILL
jgi:hypothetical protein